eukprot:scaffold62604_cov68-Phaeocystis_antarctica.AAC.3
MVRTHLLPARPPARICSIPPAPSARNLQHPFHPRGSAGPFPTGESCWLNLFDIQLVRYTGKVIYSTVRTAASTRRLNDSTPHGNPRFNSLAHPPFALIAAQPSAPAPPHVCREQSKHPRIAYRTHSTRTGPHPVPEHARSPLPGRPC